jgi:N-acetylglucosamine-6-sulfatase
MALNTDYLPTFTDLAGVRRPPYVDGRSLRPVLEGNVTTWRSAVLLEASAHYSPPFRGIRTISTGGIPKRKYVEYVGGVRELYHLEPDPHELTNSFNLASPPDALQAQLKALKRCAADSCRATENG